MDCRVIAQLPTTLVDTLSMDKKTCCASQVGLCWSHGSKPHGGRLLTLQPLPDFLDGLVIKLHILVVVAGLVVVGDSQMTFMCPWRA